MIFVYEFVSSIISYALDDMIMRILKMTLFSISVVFAFCSHIKNSHHSTNGLLRAARSEDYILGSMSRRTSGQELRGGERTAELRNRFERANENFSYEDDVAHLNFNNHR